MRPHIKTLSLLLLILGWPVLADTSIYALERQGTELRLAGDFRQASDVEQQLLATATDPVGHVFALNTIVTHLTWDETDTSYDDRLQFHAQETLNWCDEKLEANKDHVDANYYCGQAHFALSYFHGLKGNYYKAGRHGTSCINHLESALKVNPDFTDAKMHLGVAYHIADNLPPFIKMFSKLLWFIPSGNSEKSLPYLADVIENGDHYPNVARYIYSVLLLEKPETRLLAAGQLRTLIDLYPHNARFQLRLISVLLMQQEFQGTLDVAGAYLNNETPPVEPDSSLAKLWMVRAYLGLSQLQPAQRLFTDIETTFLSQRAELPGWSLAWHKLTEGQLQDLANHRAEAVKVYKEVFTIAQSTYVSEVILNAAQQGLTKPYQLPMP
jgi:tetratricopeptide (TPR) repeat protein